MPDHQNINFGSGPGGNDGDTIHAAFTKVEANTQGLHAPTQRVVSASFNITAADIAGVIVVDSPNPVLGTIQPNIVTGAGRIQIIQRGTGFFQLVAANGVTLGHPSGHRRSSSQDAIVEIVHAGSNHWNLSGGLAAPMLGPLLPTSTTVPLNEGVAVGTVVATLAVSEGTPTSVTVTGPNANRFAAVIVSPTVVRIVTAAAIDYDDAASYGLTVTASNLFGSSACALTVDVQQIQAPVLVAADFTLIETAAVNTVIGTIQNIGSPAASWAITAGNGGNLFSIANGVLRLIGQLDYGLADRHTLTITATNFGGTSQPIIVNVFVTEVNVVGGATITDFDIDHNGETGAIASFVVPFADGEVPAASIATVGVRRRDTGDLLRTQFEPRTYWPSGAVLTAELSVELPAGSDGQIIPCMIRRGDTHPSPGSAINLAAALSGRTCSVTITPISGGSTWTLDVVAAAAAAGNPWNAGPLKASKRVIADVPSSALGGICASMRCVVDLVVTKDGTIRADVQMRNDKAFGATAAAATYTYQVTCDGTAMPLVRLDGASSATRAHHQSGWFLREYATKAGGGAAPRRPLVRMPMTQINRAGVLPYLDGENGLPTGSQSFRSDWMFTKSATWDQPFDQRNIGYDMGGPGGQDWIGVITKRQASIWFTWNRTLTDLACEEAEAACSFPLYVWDTQNNEWANKVRIPTLKSALSGGSPWSYTSSHHPFPFTVSYMFTCRRSFVDAMQGMAHWLCAQVTNEAVYSGVFTNTTLGSTGEAARITQLLTTGEGMVQFRRTQMRSAGWSIRSISQASAFVPASDQPFGNLLTVALRSQFVWLLSRRATYQSWCGTTYGWYAEWSYGGQEGFYPNWQHAFAATGVYTAARLGIPEAEEWMRFNANWTLGQFTNPNDVPRWDAVNYLRWPGTGGETNPSMFVKTWAALSAKESSAGFISIGNNPPPWGDFENPGGRGYYPRYYLLDVALHADYWRTKDPALAAKAAQILDTVAQANNAPVGTTDWESSTQLGICRYWYGRMGQNEVVLPHNRTRGPRAPVVPAQSFTVPENATVGQPIAAVHWEGNIFNTSWSIVGGSSVFSIDRAGVLTLLQPLDFDITPVHTLTVQVNNPNGNATGTITINVQSLAPSLQDGVTASRPANYPVGSTVVTVGMTGAAATWSITGGDPSNFFDIDNNGVITVANALTNEASTTKTLTVEATNAYGTDTTTVEITITAAVYAPAIDQNQVFVVSLNAANDTVIGTPTAQGSPVVTWRILSGNTGNRVSINASTGQMRVAAPFTGLPSGSLSLLLEAENTGGSDQRTVLITVAEAATVFNTPTDWLGLYSLGRRLRPTYAGALLRLRRTWDSAEQDFGVTGGGVLDEAAITTWLNAAPAGQRDSYVVTIYDQSLRGQNITQPTTARQPRFTTTAGAFYTPAGGVSTKPVMDLSGGMCLVNTAFATDAAATMGTVVAMHTPGGVFLPHLVALALPGGDASYGSGTNKAGLLTLGDGNNTIRMYRGSAAGFTVEAIHSATYGANTPRTLASAIVNSTTAKLWINDDRDDVAIATVGGLVNPGEMRIGAMIPGSSTGAFSGRVYEIVIFKETAAPDADVASIEANIRTFWGFGPPVEVAPNIDPEPQTLPAVASNASPGAPVGTVTTIAGTAATWSITAGNTNNQFAVSNTGVITVNAALVIGNYALTVRAQNGAGWDEATVNIEVTGAVAPPVVTASQVFNAQEPVAQGATIGDVAWTGGTPSTWTEVSGDPGNRLLLNGAGRITAGVRLIRDDIAQILPVIRAENTGGQSQETVTVNIAANPLAYGTAGTKFLGAWALRRVRATYTGPLVRCRRASDNTEQDFAAVDVGGGLFMIDATALAAFAQGGKVFVTRWYDQSVRGQDLVQTAQALQPEICDASGAVILMPGTGNRPAIRFTGGGVGLNNLAFNTGGMQARSVYVQIAKDEASAATNRRIVSLASTVNGFDTAQGGFYLGQLTTIYTWNLGFNQSYVSFARSANVAAMLSARYAFGETPNMPLWYDGAAQSNSSAGSEAALTNPAFLRVGCRDEVDTTLSFMGRMSELVMAGDSPDADRQLIETSIRAYVGF